jgi:hypothetical protein
MLKLKKVVLVKNLLQIKNIWTPRIDLILLNKLVYIFIRLVF